MTPKGPEIWGTAFRESEQNLMIHGMKVWAVRASRKAANLPLPKLTTPKLVQDVT